MRHPVSILTLLLAALLATSAWAPAAAARPGSTEIILEGGASLPQGDLGDSFDTPAGFDADTGYEVGFRVRSRWPNGWALSPSFHYVRFGENSFLLDDGFGGTIDGAGRCSIFEYAVDFQYFLPARRHSPQLYLTAGVALTHNRYRVEYSDDTWFEEGVNALGGSIGMGVRIGDVELSALYHLNRFDTTEFYAPEDYDWDWISVRVGFALPTIR